MLDEKPGGTRALVRRRHQKPARTFARLSRGCRVLDHGELVLPGDRVQTLKGVRENAGVLEWVGFQQEVTHPGVSRHGEDRVHLRAGQRVAARVMVDLPRHAVDVNDAKFRVRAKAVWTGGRY